MKPAHLIIPTAALGAALLAAGCGGDNEASPAPRAQQVQADLPAGRIAFRRYLDGAQTTGAVFTVKPDGTGEKQITHPPAGVVDDQPDWSPDGRTIAFERCSDEAPCSVWTADATGGEPAQVHVRCKLEPICDASAPVWTPDGRLVVDLAQGRERHHGELGQIQRFSLELIGKRGSQRTIFARDNWTGDAKESTVSPDGRTLVYMAWNSWRTKPANGTALYAIRIDGTHRRRLTPWKLGAGDHPAFSPDARTLFFRSFAEDDSRQGDYYTIDVKTRRRTRLTHFEAGSRVLSGSFSPDGKSIVHARDGLGGNADVFVMRADGSGVAPVTRSQEADSAADWGPPAS
jgi:Tol biopolymer transport system component